MIYEILDQYVRHDLSKIVLHCFVRLVESWLLTTKHLFSF